MGGLEMYHDISSDEDTDLSDSELDEEVDKYFKELKKGKHKVKYANEVFVCPFCNQRKKRREYNIKELLQHTSGVGKSYKRGLEEKAKHLALTKYLETDLITHGPSKPVVVAAVKEEIPLDIGGHDERLVWPCVGIVANIPTRLADDGRLVGESGSKLRDEYIRRGFNPIRVHPQWNYKGHSGSAIVEFDRDWPGYFNAMAFERAYMRDGHGREDWFTHGVQKSGLHAWVARSDDYNARNVVGDYLRKNGDLRFISEIKEAEARKHERLLSSIHNNGTTEIQKSARANLN